MFIFFYQSILLWCAFTHKIIYKSVFSSGHIVLWVRSYIDSIKGSYCSCIEALGFRSEKKCEAYCVIDPFKYWCNKKVYYSSFEAIGISLEKERSRSYGWSPSNVLVQACGRFFASPCRLQSRRRTHLVSGIRTRLSLKKDIENFKICTCTLLWKKQLLLSNFFIEF